MSGVNFKFGTTWVPVPANQVNFQFVPPNCTNSWVTLPGKNIPLTFNVLRPDIIGKQVPIVFECGTTSSTVTLFSGFIDLPDGASLLTDLSTIQSIAVSYEDGAEVNYVLNTYPAILLGVIDNGDGGEIAPTPLWTQVNVGSLHYDGGEFTFDFIQDPAINLLFPVYDGGESSFVLSTALQFGLVDNGDGGEVTVVVDTLENWYLYDGAEVSASLSTNNAFILDMFGGETSAVDLSVFPSEGMGIFQAYADAAVGMDIRLLVAVLLYPNEIKDPGWFNWDITGQIGIDLNNVSCCPVKDSPLRIELTGGPAADERYSGDKTVMTIELSTRQRFSFNMFAGEYFSAIEPNFFAFSFFGGDQALITAIPYARYNFNLCKGNFIPDGDHVNVELVSTDLSNCSSDLIFDGGEAHLEIQANPNFQVPLPEGAFMSFDLVYEAIIPWIFDFYAGEYVTISNPEFVLPNYEGGMMVFTMADIEYLAYSGESMTIDRLVTDYSVEFLEQGCLDNEFVPMNANGDADFAKFNPVPVELDQYIHSILARCF